jgi:hypothetical protein
MCHSVALKLGRRLNALFAFERRSMRTRITAPLLVAITFGALLPPTFAVVYDAEADFSATANPNGLWQHGWSTGLTTVLNLYDTHSVTQGALDTWNDQAYHDVFGTPLISHNPTPSAIGVHAAHSLSLHPGPDGEYSRLRWMAPAAGMYAISATFTGADVATTDVHVLLNNSSPTLFSGNVTDQGDSHAYMSSTLMLAPGDSIDFVVGYGANGHYNDATRLEATITAAAVPEPNSLGLALTACAATAMLFTIQPHHRTDRQLTTNQ